MLSFLLKNAECDLKGSALKELKEAKTAEAIVAAIGRKVSHRTPNLLAAGSLFLQPGEERRRSGSHYTPRKLTQPIVEKTLEPVLKNLGEHPTPEQLLDLKVCDLAMGSAAFLVEACRQLADKLVEAWERTALHRPLTSPPSPLSTSGEGGPEPVSYFSSSPSPRVERGPGGEVKSSPVEREARGEVTSPYMDLTSLSSPLTSPPNPLSTSGEGGQEGLEVPGYVYELCRELRSQQTEAEALLWGVLRNRQLERLKFRRQHPFGRYIADFYCAQHRLVIELDGSIHDHPDQQDYDCIREEALHSLNLTILRFRNEEVKTHLEQVLQTILQTVSSSPSPRVERGPGGEVKSPPVEREPRGEVTSPDMELTPLSRPLTSPPNPLSTSGEGGPEPSSFSSSPSPRVERGPGGEVYSRKSLLPPDNIDRILYARRLVAQRCLYGVDKNPFAVNLAKLSLWLMTLSKDLPFTFLDHALKCGDSLVGLTQAEIGSFGRDPLADLPLIQLIQEQVDRASSYRTEIQALDTRTDADAERNLERLQKVDQELAESRLTADLRVAAFFDGVGKSKKAAQELLETYQTHLRHWRQSEWSGDEETLEPLQEIRGRLRRGDRGIQPFNWEIEFPEVFGRKNPGFDAIVGNPPFAGKNTTINAHLEGYLDWLKVVHPESHGNADLVAHFFRRAFTLLRQGGTLGLIATNTIAQGNTRSTGLRFICNNGGMIYNATRRYKWPGLAAVVVSLVHIMKVSDAE